MRLQRPDEKFTSTDRYRRGISGGLEGASLRVLEGKRKSVRRNLLGSLRVITQLINSRHRPRIVRQEATGEELEWPIEWLVHS